jgi:undecaprenyl-diphosphatase
MTYLDALIFSVVEGISEFLPISSTGHLILTAKLLDLPQTEFMKSFEIVIQLGAILSVLVLYWRSFLIRGEELKRVLCAFVPTAVVGFVLYKLIKKHLMADFNIVLWALFIGGILMILFEKSRKGQPDSGKSGITSISYKKAFCIGLIQALAVIPGVSRSAATIIGGLMLGVERRTIIEFSFLLAVPTMAAATALDLVKSGGGFTADQAGVLMVGFAGSFVFALMSIKWLLGFIKNHSFIGFGFYRIFVAWALWVVLAFSQSPTS